MHEARRNAREWLAYATLTEFNDMVVYGKIYTSEEIILRDKFIRGMSNLQIAEHLCCSVETINVNLRKCYDKVARVLEQREREQENGTWLAKR